LKRSSKVTIISGIVAVVIIAAALTIHFRLSETEKSEIKSGAEQNEKESPNQVVNEIVNSLQNKPNLEQNENAKQAENTAPNTTTGQIEISIKEVDEVYRWSSSDEINPAITLTTNVDNVIQITNPTDTKHEFVIEADGKELAGSGDIGPDSSGKLTIKPATAGIFEYHCEYHPDTMKGIINVKP
jgi:plastocyanin